MTTTLPLDTRPPSASPSDGRANGVHPIRSALTAPFITKPDAERWEFRQVDTKPVETPQTDRKGTGSTGFYLAAAASLIVSVNTSWLYFGERLHIPRNFGAHSPLLGFIGERFVMFAVLEIAFLACGWAMRAHVHHHGTPGPARLFAWSLVGFAAYMAIELSGLSAGLARVALGPLLGLVSLHLALGIDMRDRGPSTGTWAKVTAELRERGLSRLGLGDDQRDAAARSRDRALHRAAKLATARRAIARQSRLARAVRAGGAASDAAQQCRLVGEVAALRHLDDLADLTFDSPWRGVTPPQAQHLITAAQQQAEALREAAARDAAALRDEALCAAAAQHEQAGAAQRRAEALIADARAEAQQHLAAAQQASAEVKAAADTHAQRLAEEARADAEQTRAAALATLEALRGEASDEAPKRAARPAAQHPKRSASPVSDEALRAALHRKWPDEIPSLRAAAQHLRQRFGSCSDKRVAAAVEALRAQRFADLPNPPNGDLS